MKFDIGVDVDGVVADLYTEWLGRYNRDYDDNLHHEDLKSWSITKHVKPECGNKIFDYLRAPNLYSSIKPIEGAQDGVQYLRDSGHRVIFVTSNIRGMTDQKWDWLVEYGFLPEGHYTDDMIVCHDKSLVRLDNLIDDSIHNLESSGVRGILFGDYAHSRDAGWKHSKAKDWKEVIELF